MQQIIIVFLRDKNGARSVSEIGLAVAFDYEFDEYCRASRQSWPLYHRGGARTYARELAEKHGLTFVPGDDDMEDEQEQMYLD